jgi:hypothetical protein
VHLGGHVEDIQADATAIVYVGVVHRRLKAHLRRFKGIARRHSHRQGKDTVFVHSACGSLS